jgi:hypothetical protein
MKTTEIPKISSLKFMEVQSHKGLKNVVGTRKGLREVRKYDILVLRQCRSSLIQSRKMGGAYMSMS